MGAAFFYYIDFERIKRLHSLQQMRTQIAQNLHDDVDATLNNISLLSEMAKIKVDKDAQLSKEYIEQIHIKSRRMIDAMSDMLWTLNPENDTMEKTILRMKQFAEDLQNYT
jgi:signal transduction histidine kinase